jgi:hypothetical protein
MNLSVPECLNERHIDVILSILERNNVMKKITAAFLTCLFASSAFAQSNGTIYLPTTPPSAVTEGAGAAAPHDTHAGTAAQGGIEVSGASTNENRQASGENDGKLAPAVTPASQAAPEVVIDAAGIKAETSK